MSEQGWASAWITGASTGIGRELALNLAARGVRVAATARGADKLAALAAADPRIIPAPADVTDPEQLGGAYTQAVAAMGVPDLVILNAGVWHPMGASKYDAVKAAESMAVNYQGLVNGLALVIPAMIARGSGQIALVASVAGYRGLPQAAAYAPSKAAVIALAEVLHPDLKRKGVHLSVVNPGFVETPMTAVNDFPMPFIIPASDAADRIIRGLEAKAFEIAFPWQLVTMLKIARLLPYPIFFWVARTFLTPKPSSPAS